MSFKKAEKGGPGYNRQSQKGSRRWKRRGKKKKKTNHADLGHDDKKFLCELSSSFRDSGPKERPRHHYRKGETARGEARRSVFPANGIGLWGKKIFTRALLGVKHPWFAKKPRQEGTEKPRKKANCRVAQREAPWVEKNNSPYTGMGVTSKRIGGR